MYHHLLGYHQRSTESVSDYPKSENVEDFNSNSDIYIQIDAVKKKEKKKNKQKKRYKFVLYQY